MTMQNAGSTLANAKVIPPAYASWAHEPARVRQTGAPIARLVKPEMLQKGENVRG